MRLSTGFPWLPTDMCLCFHKDRLPVCLFDLVLKSHTRVLWSCDKSTTISQISSVLMKLHDKLLIFKWNMHEEIYFSVRLFISFEKQFVYRSLDITKFIRHYNSLKHWNEPSNNINSFSLVNLPLFRTISKVSTYFWKLNCWWFY